jgi:hypothetical protein
MSRLLNDWRNDQWGVMLESLDSTDHSLWRMTKWSGDGFGGGGGVLMMV